MMDRTSYRVLKYVRRCGQPMSRAALEVKFGREALKNVLPTLTAAEFLIPERRTRFTASGQPVNVSTGVYRLGPAGRAFLEMNPADLFRQWLAVALSVISTVVSIIALCG